MGQIEGDLNLTNDTLNFEPYIKGSNMLKKYEMCVNLLDVSEVNVLAVPSSDLEDIDDLEKELEKDYLLQILLDDHGSKSMGKYLDDLFASFKSKKEPYVCLYFKLKNTTVDHKEMPNKEKEVILDEVQNNIFTIKETLKIDSKAAFNSKIPYFEFLYEKFRDTDAVLLKKITKKA